MIGRCLCLVCTEHQLNCCVRREPNSAITRTLCSVNLTVPIFSTCGPNNVPSLDLNNLSPSALHAHSSACYCAFCIVTPLCSFHNLMITIDTPTLYAQKLFSFFDSRVYSLRFRFLSFYTSNGFLEVGT